LVIGALLAKPSFGTGIRLPAAKLFKVPFRDGLGRSFCQRHTHLQPIFASLPQKVRGGSRLRLPCASEQSETAIPPRLRDDCVEVYPMLSLLVTLLIILLIFSVIWWIVGMIPLPPPVKNIVLVVIAVILLVWLISVLLPFAGMGAGFHNGLPCR
jgi:hypothetical protein